MTHTYGMRWITLVVLFGGWLSADEPVLRNLDFAAGSLVGWEGQGFHLQKEPEGSKNQAQSVSSRDDGPTARKALLHRTVVIPPGAGVIRFSAYAVRPANCAANDNLDVFLMATGRRVIPKKIRQGGAWAPANGLATITDGEPPLYIWPVAKYAGQTLRIVLVDEDDRPGCHLVSSGFEILPAGEFERQEFGRFMAKLAQKHKLPPMIRYDTRHFTALSNAEEGFSENHIRSCELLYATFCDHFRRKGFMVHDPVAKLMLALFDSQVGFEAYLAQKMSPLITGLYHKESNRLVSYDYGQNELYLANKQAAEQKVQQNNSLLERRSQMDSASRKAQESRADANAATIMHETAHQLSFNCGLLNREGDVPIWLAEGLACYCEATSGGKWQGIGELSPERLNALARWAADGTRLTPLQDLASNDNWLREQKDGRNLLLGYAQSWALFRMLIEEEPRALRAYLSLIYERRTAEHRMADFQQAFGPDLHRLEARHRQYVKNLIPPGPK
jgi:hypothetical protein